MRDSPDRSEHHTLRGATDRPALLTIRDTVEEMEPLATAELDDFLNPSLLEVILEEGLCDADEARLDIQWTTLNDYKFHYTDTAGVNFRWGKHPHGGDYIHVTGLEHYHPPPDASSDPDEVEDSCIAQSPEELVTRAVLKLWRVAYHTDSYEHLNAVSYPQIESLSRSMNPTKNPDIYRCNTLMERFCRSRSPAFSNPPPPISPPESLLISIFRVQIGFESV